MPAMKRTSFAGPSTGKGSVAPFPRLAAKQLAAEGRFATPQLNDVTFSGLRPEKSNVGGGDPLKGSPPPPYVGDLDPEGVQVPVVTGGGYASPRLIDRRSIWIQRS